MSLKEELNNLVDQYQIKSGIVARLTEKAYEGAVRQVRDHAACGRKTAHVTISFEGCKAGYHQHFEAVKQGVRNRFLNEGLSVGKSNLTDELFIEW